MKATELRIGNFIRLNRMQTEPKVGIVIGMAQESPVIQVKYEFENQWQQKDWNEIAPFIDESQGDLFPIPLTKEWLLKFGFEKSGYNYYFPMKINEKLEKRFLRKETYDNRWSKNEKGWLCIGSWEGFNDIPIKYVHQLQNLYFALTGEELELKHHIR